MNVYYVAGLPYSDELYHHGIKGQRWGVRRFQNPDGTLTEAGKKHYYGNKNARTDSIYDLSDKQRRHFNKTTEKEFNKAYKKTAYKDRHSKYGSGEGRPDWVEAAYSTRARKEIVNTEELKESREKLYEAAMPELRFENDKKLWKKYGYDPDDPSFETDHDVSNSYWNAKERYMSDMGLAYGSDARKNMKMIRKMLIFLITIVSNGL